MRPNLAYGLQARELPPVDGELFIAAGAAVAQRAATLERAARSELEGVLRRALEQAAALRSDN